MLNKVFLIGNLTKDAELTETASGISVCRFSIGVARQYTQDGERMTDFFDCTAWRGTAEAIAKSCKKGHKVCVTGSVQTRTYEDNNGSKRKVFDIIVQDIEFLTPKSVESDEFGTRASSPTHSSSGGRTSRNKPTLQAMDDDEDIPF